MNKSSNVKGANFNNHHLYPKRINSFLCQYEGCEMQAFKKF